MSIKFYINQGRRCAQTAIKSVVTRDTLSYEQLDDLTGRKTGQITTPLQVAYGLYKLGVNFVYPVKPFFLDANLDELISKSSKDFGEEICKKTNFEFMEKSWKEIKESGNYSLYNNFPFEIISQQLKSRKNPIILINYDVFVGRDDKKSGHYLIIREIGENFVRVMNSGPCNAHPDQIISKKRLENSLMETPLDYGVVFV